MSTSCNTTPDHDDNDDKHGDDDDDTEYVDGDSNIGEGMQVAEYYRTRHR
jgi:hypothetical protein